MLAPKLDTRTRQQVVSSALLLAAHYTPDWAGAADIRDPGRNLIEIFARLVELLIERLNRVPEKNFLSFLDMTGIERFAGSPAQAPVTFVVSKSAPGGGLVPAGSRVATAQSETVDAQVFETRRAFFATPAKLERIIAVLPAMDRYVEVPVPEPPEDREALSQRTPITIFDPAGPALTDVPHVLYIGSERLFTREDSAPITLTFFISAGTFPPAGIEWRTFDKDARAWIPLSSTVSYDFSTPGEVPVTFDSLTNIQKTVVDGVEDFWLAAYFNGAFDASFVPPVISTIEGVAAAPAQAIEQFDAAFRNSEPLDVSKPYQPFGRRPAYGDAFYFSSKIAFGADVEQATLTFTIRPYVEADLEAQFNGIPATRTIRTRAVWQYLDAAGRWQDLATYEHHFVFDPAPAINVTAVSDEAPAGEHAGEGTFIGQSEASTAVVPLSGFQDVIGLQSVNGVENRWMRVLLLSDNPYGDDGVLNPTGSAFVGPLFIPPTIERVQIDYTPRVTPVPVTNLRTLDNFRMQTVSPIRPFTPLSSRLQSDVAVFGTAPALYFAFDRKFGQVFISLLAHLAGLPSTLTSPLESGDPQIAWEYWSHAHRWSPLDAEDETADLTATGTVGFIGPDDSEPIDLFPALEPRAQHWFRARLSGGSYDHPPRVLGLYLNTVAADNRVTDKKPLIVGSSNGERSQMFTLVRGPVLGGELWVREPEHPSEDELLELEDELRADLAEDPEPGALGSIFEQHQVTGGRDEIWVRWRGVPNFLASSPHSRHYTLDAVAAVIRFGDGQNGLIPPVATDNIVLRGFQTGGGELANRAAAALGIQDLKTSLPFIDTVFNVEGGSGGADPWSDSELLEFGPQAIKNRGRSVTVEDCEWLIRAHFSQVARARCLATRAPGPGGALVFSAGAFTAIVVPHGEERRPQPSQSLIRKIRSFLIATSFGPIADNVHVRGPDYTEIAVAASLTPTLPELASLVLRRAAAAVESFLHPVTGGENGTGYGFGRAVYLSEIQAVLERVHGVDHVEEASFVGLPGVNTFLVAENSLASSGDHEVRIV